MSGEKMREKLAEHYRNNPAENKPFTPTTERVREQYAVDGYTPSFDDTRRAAFDRWLDATIAAARAEGAAAEREACAQVVLTEIQTGTYTLRDDLAAAIRARSGDGVIQCVTPGCNALTDPAVSNVCERHRREVFGPRP